MKIASLDDLPVKDGFRLRGLDMTRIETFTDAAFAFALTLLVLSSTPPNDLKTLERVLRDIPTFVFCAVNLMIFWNGHNEWSRRFGLDDFGTMAWSVALVSTILIYVYPLRYVFNLFVSSVGMRLHLPIGHPFETNFDAADVNRAFVIYGAGFVANSVVLIGLYFHALRQSVELQLNSIEKHVIYAEIGGWVILSAVGVISIILALLMPGRPGSPGYAYVILPILMPYYGYRMGKRREAMKNATDPSHSELLEALGAKDRKAP